MDNKKIEDIIRQLIIQLGEDPNREGLVQTPKRVAKTLKEFTSGYKLDPKKVVHEAIFNENINNMIVLKNIEFYSLCEHHILPFFGKCHIGYIPQNNILGVSKLARIVDMYSKRLQIQERLTEEIADTLMKIVNPKGVGVVLEAQHLCMMMRGVNKQNSTLKTSSLLGLFRESIATREEFLSMVTT